MTGRQFADFETPAEILGKIELEPKDVKTILLTHLHFDHVGNIGAFKDATILLQRSEYEGWKRALEDAARPADRQAELDPVIDESRRHRPYSIARSPMDA